DAWLVLVPRYERFRQKSSHKNRRPFNPFLSADPKNSEFARRIGARGSKRAEKFGTWSRRQESNP
ncbi:MAG TPA: hypothetical protein VEL12_12445, partial [Candidatus Nitrosopolaris sp.]|nr:hypothetical protein [Candidatus Nitrosopolaris sp.]